MLRFTQFEKFRLLNKRRGPILRGCAAFFGLFASALLSGSTVVARSTSRVFWQGDILLGARRIAWLSRRGRMQLRFGGGDHAFDFTSGLVPFQLDRVGAFVSRNAHRNGQRTNCTDALFIAARRCVDDASNTRAFFEAAQALLDTIPPVGSVTLVDGAEKPSPLSHQDAVAALVDCASLFQDIPWFVLSGTFLGLIREDGFLPHDYDIDVGVMQDVPLVSVTDRLARNANFVLRKVDIQPAFGAQTAPRPMLLKLVHRTGVPVDIFYHYETGDDRLLHGSSLHHWFNSHFSLQDYNLEGVAVRGPADADRYLTENYGDWRTPVTDFNCSTDTPNLAIVRHPITITMFLQRLARFAEMGHPNLPKLAAELTQEGIISPRGEGFVVGENLLP